MRDTSLKMLQSPAGWRQKRGISSFLHPVEGVIKFDGTTFVFIDSEGKNLFNIPAKDIKWAYVGEAKASPPQIAITLRSNSQAGKTDFKLWFLLYKQKTESGKDKYLTKQWKLAFKRAGIRNTRTISLWVLLIAFILLIASFIIVNWSHTTTYLPGR